jgi:hypothetical protein
MAYLSTGCTKSRDEKYRIDRYVGIFIATFRARWAKDDISYHQREQLQGMIP